MKRFLCLFFALLLILCSCGGNETQNSENSVKGNFTGKTYGALQYCIGFRIDDGALAKLFDDALAEMISDGTAGKICENWLDTDLIEYSEGKQMPESEDDSLYDVREAGEIKVGVDTLSYPMTFRDAQKQVCGLDADILRELSNRTNINAVFVNCPRESAAGMLESGDIDCFIGALALSGKTQDKMLVTRPYLTTRLTLIISDKVDGIDDLDGLTDMKIGVRENSYALEYVNKCGTAFSEIATYDSDYHAYFRLREHRVHAVLVEEPFAIWAQKGNLEN